VDNPARVSSRCFCASALISLTFGHAALAASPSPPRTASAENVAGGSRLVLAESATAIPNPTQDPTLLQLSPIWLNSAKGPVLAWLEGGDPQRLIVRSARWSNGKWVEFRTVAPAGPGSQLALTGKEFGGRPILVWAAFDGKDDEILWSRLEPSRGGRWSRPQRVAPNNKVPDVTPTLAVRGGKLHAAWARYDGEVYRVVSATFDGAAWSAPRTVSSGAASAPRYESAGGHLTLLARGSSPGGVIAFELDADGEASGREALWLDEGERREPKAVEIVEITGDGLSLRSSGRESAGTQRVPWERPAPAVLQSSSRR
jgi:hypothetical protein